MIYFILILVLIIIIAVFAAWLLAKRLKTLREEYQEAHWEIIRLQGEVTARDHIIKRTEEINADSAKKKQALHEGGPGDRARAATGAMSDIARDSNKDGTASGG